MVPVSNWQDPIVAISGDVLNPIGFIGPTRFLHFGIRHCAEHNSIDCNDHAAETMKQTFIEVGFGGHTPDRLRPAEYLDAVLASDPAADAFVEPLHRSCLFTAISPNHSHPDYHYRGIVKRLTSFSTPALITPVVTSSLTAFPENSVQFHVRSEARLLERPLSTHQKSQNPHSFFWRRFDRLHPGHDA
jgi:hypothetical protein